MFAPDPLRCGRRALRPFFRPAFPLSPRRPPFHQRSLHRPGALSAHSEALDVASALYVSSWRSLCHLSRCSYFTRRSLSSLRRVVFSALSPFAPGCFPDLYLWPPRYFAVTRSVSSSSTLHRSTCCVTPVRHNAPCPRRVLSLQLSRCRAHFVFSLAAGFSSFCVSDCAAYTPAAAAAAAA
jgi:hypothetical protein